MRHVLLGLGLFGIFLGLLLMNNDHALGTLWLQLGAGFFALGLATCDIVAAIKTEADRRDYRGRLEEFRLAAQTQDLQKMVQLLEGGGIPGDLARQTAKNVVEESNADEV